MDRNVLIRRPRSGSFVAWLDGGEVLCFDGEGRLRDAHLGRRWYRRGIEGKVLERLRAPSRSAMQASGRFLTEAEIDDLVTGVRGRLEERLVRGALGTAEASPDEGELTDTSGDARDAVLDRILRWDPDRYRADGARCREVYAPVGILPPDRYASLVVQATVGCSFNRCTFCSSFEEVVFRARSAEDFRRHVRRVADFLGQGIGSYRSLFLGSANAALLPTERLAELLAVLAEELPPEGPGLGDGVHAFVDGFTETAKTPAEYARLRELGLRTLYLGLETGSDRLRRRLGKPGTTPEYVDLARSVKAGGISLGVMLLVGAGGEELAAEHVRETATTLDAMGLGPGDVVFLSPLLAPEDPAARRALLGERPLDGPSLDDQGDLLASAVPEGVRVRPYEVACFLY